MSRRQQHHNGRLHLDATRNEAPTPQHSRRRSRAEATSWQSPSHHQQQSHASLSASSILLPQRQTPPYATHTAANDPQLSHPMSPALKLARQAPMAGYLNKLGGTVKHFKRRFFVVQPTTTLYYFLSTEDEAPRGCVDLEGATIVPKFQDSVYQFAIQWDKTDDEDPVEVILEARSEQEANDWIRVLNTERIDVVQASYKKAQLAISGCKSRIAELEQSLDECKLIEADRDGALEDAANWKAQFESLDESIRMYAQSMRNEIASGEESKATEETEENDAVVETLDPATVPGRHFSTLWNTVEQMKENLSLASNEANAAIQDVKTANTTVQTLEKRMANAETHLCKIWEENCELRKVVKQHKREKRVLVKEVKSLREQQLQQDNESCSSGDEEEQKLLDDIEAHVQTSIQLQRELVGGKQQPNAQHDTNGRSALNISEESDASEGIVGTTLHLSCGPSALGAPCHGKGRIPVSTATAKIPMASLLDGDDDEDGDSDSSSSCSDSKPMHDLQRLGRVGMDLQNASQSADGDYSERSNPLGKLDDVDLHDDTPPKLIAVSSSSSTAQSRQPTSQLSCPLADVAASARDELNTADGEVYHLTFYSRKIGLQFQKVPPPPAQAKGLLTEAMTTDLARVTSASEKTAAELRRIANISGTAKTDYSNEMTCQVAKPIDAVLVCGFVGFDDSSGNKRPNLGARLVAFDGVSLEVGAWTFQSVRKAIQARRRPLTLSFRNDFLTTAQRKILTKAVKDMENLSPAADGIPPGVNNRHEAHLSRSSTSLRSSQKDDEMSSATGSSAGLGHLSESSAASFSKFRSFSEAGSSVSVLSAVGPLVSNLLAKRREPFTPEYLRRPSVSIEESPHHLDFKAELL